MNISRYLEQQASMCNHSEQLWRCDTQRTLRRLSQSTRLHTHHHSPRSWRRSPPHSSRGLQQRARRRVRRSSNPKPFTQQPLRIALDALDSAHTSSGERQKESLWPRLFTIAHYGHAHRQARTILGVWWCKDAASAEDHCCASHERAAHTHVSFTDSTEQHQQCRHEAPAREPHR